MNMTDDKSEKPIIKPLMKVFSKSSARSPQKAAARSPGAEAPKPTTKSATSVVMSERRHAVVAPPVARPSIRPPVVNALDRRFDELRQQGRKAVMPYLSFGYPELDSAQSIVPSLAAAGADVLELGIPFSDPLADGPVIQASSQRALDNGMTMQLALAQLRVLNAAHTLPPVVLMTYTNLLLHHGFEAFAADARAAGASGVIVPDLPVPETGLLRETLAAQGIHLIYMVTPNLDDARIAAIAKLARGFIYLVSVLGVTGVRTEVPDLSALAQQVRRHTDLPLALGFGISTPDQARSAHRYVDGVIIGSALVRSLQSPGSAAADAARFLEPFRT